MGLAARSRSVPICASLLVLPAFVATVRPALADELLCPGAPVGIEYFCGEDIKSGQQVRPGQPPALQRVKFLDRLLNVGNEDFEGFLPDTRGPFALHFPGTAGELTGTLAPAGEGRMLSTLDQGRFPTSGLQYMQSVSYTHLTLPTN